MKAGRVWYVGAGPGDPELISVLGLRLLRDAQVVVHDRGVATELLEQCQEHAEIHEACVSAHVSPSELEAIASRIAEAVRAGLRVVRLKTGDPLFFSRALDELALLNREAIDVQVVPGIASPLGAAAFAGVPLTSRSGLGAITFISTLHLTDCSAIAELLLEGVQAAESLCVLCSAAQVAPTLRGLSALPRWAHAPTAVVTRATTPEQRVIEGPLDRLLSRFETELPGEPTLLLLGEGIAWRPGLAWYERLPLFGRRLLLCRPQHQAQESARAIRGRGARPILLPLIRIEPPSESTGLNQCVGQLSKHDWVIFTSANGVEAFMDALVTANLDSRAFGRSKIAVIGPGTARPLARWGIVPDLVAQEHVAESLARELLQVGAGKSVLLVRAEVARDTLPNSLREAGLSVTVVASYRTRKLGPEQATHLRTIIEGQGIDAVLLTSSSMADSLASALGPNAPEVLARTCIASIGPITTATLGKLGIRADVTASEYTVAGLLDALEQHFGTTGPAEPRATKTNQ